MSPALVRASRVPWTWTPRKLPGVVAWWRADTIAGVDGDPVASWTDIIAGQSVAQAGAGKPLLKLAANGINSQPVVRFASGSSQYLDGALGVVPARGPVYCFVVARLTTAPNPVRIASIEKAGTSGAGWAATVFGNAIGATTFGVSDLSGVYGATAGVSFFALIGISGTAYSFDRDNLYTLNTAAAANATAGADTLTFGRRLNTTNNYFNGDLAEIIFMSAAPSASDRYSMARYVWRRYGLTMGTPYNAAAPVTTPSADVSGTCVETSVIYVPGGWNGFTHWCVFSPYGSNLVANENGTVLQSNDGNTWASPAGCPVPVIAYPGGGAAGNNADASLFLNPADNKLYLFYIVENATGPSNGVWWSSSSDGSTWSAPAQLISSLTDTDGEPKVVYDTASARWWLYTIDLRTPSATVMYRRVSATGPTSGYGAAVACTLTLPSAQIWHSGNYVKIGTRWVTAMSDNNTIRREWIVASDDGLVWYPARMPAIVQGGVSGTTVEWDNAGSIYRLNVIDAGDGLNAWGWYCTLGGNTVTRMAQRVTIPLSEIP